MLQADVVTALGTMSGTSLDGVDASVLRTDGVAIHGFGPTSYRPYSTAEQSALRAHLGRWPEDCVDAATRIVEDAHIAVMRPFDGIDLAGFHGQTLAHDPAQGRTHQCGDGYRIARALGYPVAWDFRSEDVRRGGQGAPLAPFYHFALAKWLKAEAPMAFLNLGGVGNITWVDPRLPRPEEDGALLAFDTGPANAPINDAMRQRRGLAFDDAGALARQGQVDKGILAAFALHPYFEKPPPKSLDRDDFATLLDQTAVFDDADAIATLTAAAVEGVARAMAHCPIAPSKVLVTGGGRKNATMMDRLKVALRGPVQPVESVGLDGDMLEAQAFAYLAVRVARGLPISAAGTTAVARPCNGGQLATPA